MLNRLIYLQANLSNLRVFMDSIMFYHDSMIIIVRCPGSAEEIRFFPNYDVIQKRKIAFKFSCTNVYLSDKSESVLWV